MKNFKAFLGFTALLWLLAACRHNDPEANESTRTPLEPGTVYEGEGRIVGQELAACICCGGMWLVTESQDSVLFRTFPPEADFLVDNVPFPIAVKYKILTDSNQCWEWKRTVEALSLEKI